MHTKPLQRLALLTLVTLLPALSVAHAQTYVKGTQVSYDKDIDKTQGTNDSAVYIDEANDTTDENYAQFSCEDGSPIFYWNSSQNLVNQKQYDDGTSPPITFKVDENAPVKFTSWTVSTDEKFNPKILSVDDKFDAQVLRLFQNAKSKVIVTINRYDGKPIKAVFYPKGLKQAFDAVNNCR